MGFSPLPRSSNRRRYSRPEPRIRLVLGRDIVQISRAMRALPSFATLLLRRVLVFFRSRSEQAIVELALRPRLSVGRRITLLSPTRHDHMDSPAAGVHTAQNGRGIVSRLKRLIQEIHWRSLWQVLGIYLVGAWVAFQGIEAL